jgi:hypothetical protein
MVELIGMVVVGMVVVGMVVLVGLWFGGLWLDYLACRVWKVAFEFQF